MSRIDGSDPTAHAGTVVSFSAEDRRTLAKNKTRKAARSTVSAADQSDAQSAGSIVVPKYSAFTEEPEGRELFGFVLDGKTSDERSPDEEDLIDELVGLLRDGGKDTIASGVIFKSGDIKASMNDSGTSIQALTYFGPDNKPIVFISRDLGFRDTILSAHLAYADVTVNSARSMGINLSEGDIGKQLSETIASGSLVDIDYDDSRPGEVDAEINGDPVRGLPR